MNYILPAVARVISTPLPKQIPYLFLSLALIISTAHADFDAGSAGYKKMTMQLI